MQEAIEQLLSQTQVALARHGLTEAVVGQALLALKQLQPQTEQEMLVWALGYKKLTRLMAEQAPSDVAQAYADLHQQAQAIYEQLNAAPPAQDPPAGEGATESAAAQAVVAARSVALQCEAELAHLRIQLQAEGYSEHALNAFVVAARGFETHSGADSAIVFAAIVRAVDLALEVAAEPDCTALRTLREGLLAMDPGRAGAEDDTRLDAAAWAAQAQAVVEQVRQALASGETAQTAMLRGMTALQVLATRAPQDDESDEGAELVMQVLASTTTALMELIRPHLSADQQAQMLPVQTSMTAVFEPSEDALSADATRAALAQHSMVTALSPLAQLGAVAEHDNAGFAGTWADQPVLRQALQQVVALTQRALALTQDGLQGLDAKVAESLRQRLTDGATLMRAAPNAHQLLKPQQTILRAVAWEMRQLERRGHLMLARPLWPTAPEVVDANAVFFSGSAPAQAVLDAACQLVGLHRANAQAGAHPGVQAAARPAVPPASHQATQLAPARWHLLRRCGVAVFDFSRYDPVVADFGGQLPLTDRDIAQTLAAAAPVAAVAYECGWAWATGTPMVILARQGQTLPFDIDVEPVVLAGETAHDAQQVALALQAAIYSAPKGHQGDALWATARHAQEQWGQQEVQHREPIGMGLLAAAQRSAQAQDATGLRRALAVLLARPAQRAWALLNPVRAPRYAPQVAQSQLFHVTAFRPWTTLVQTALRQVCEQNAWAYRIGSERLTPEVLDSIWSDLCTAHAVVADLSNLNPNAVLELGMAHAIGRPSLIISAQAGLPLVLPAIRHLRVHVYDTAHGREDLVALLDRFLKDPTGQAEQGT
jgi:hypothetical protein